MAAEKVTDGLRQVTREVAAPAGDPVLPSELMSFNEQRTWVLGALAACQAYKLYQTGEQLLLPESSSSHLLLKWSCIDLAVIGYIIPRLRIPRLDWPIRSRLILLMPLLALNLLLFSTALWTFLAAAPYALVSSLLPDYRMAVDEHRVRTRSINDPHQHILGRHTIHVLPHATARLNPYAESFCLPVNDPKAVAFIPLTFNNSKPHTLTYSHTDFQTGETSTFDVAEAQLLTALAKKAKQKHHQSDDDAIDDWLLPALAPRTPKLIEFYPPTRQAPSHALKIKRPGLIKLVHIRSGPPHPADIPFSRSEEVQVVECPAASFADATVATETHKCLGESAEIDLLLHGVPPFTLEYVRASPGRKSETVSVEGISAPHPLAPGAASDISLPLNFTLDAPGQTSLKLVKIADALGNAAQVPNEPERRISVHALPRVSVVGCSEERPVKLLEGAKASFTLSADGLAKDEGPYVVRVRRPNGKVDEIKMARQAGATSTSVDVAEPGEYEVLAVAGRYCKGDVLAPSQCLVVVQARPTLSMEFEPVTDQCAGSIGLRAHVQLSGEPPFRLQYQVTHVDDSKRKRTTKHTKTIMQTRDEILFQPEQVGHFTWEAVKIEDAAYMGSNGVDVKKGLFSGSTEVRPLASAAWKKGSDDIKSCEGKTVSAEVELTGMPPWSIQYESQYGSSRQKHTLKNIKSSPARVEVPIPSKLDKSGGTFALSLVQVEDKRGCKRALQTADLNIRVLRTKPTAKFYGSKDRLRKIRQGQDITLPLRLTGEAPWKVKYRVHRSSGESKERTVSVASPNGELLVDQDGTYELLQVHDRFCEGVVGADKDYDVEYLSRPTLSIRFDDHMNDTSSLLHRHQGLKRQDVCVNKVDSIELLLTGAPPFTVSYDVTTPTQPRKSKTLLAVQHSATLMLLSDEPGRYVYDITGVSDSLYENPSDGTLLAQVVAHHGKSVRFEQKVVPLPSASFKASKVAPRFCVSDELGSRKADEAASTTDLVLKLEGEAPFQLELEVKPIRSSLPPQRFSAHDIQPKEWPVKLPYGFSNAGRYEVTLWSVQDANGCERVVDKSSFSSAPSFDDNTQVAIRPPSAMVDVADTANIIAVQPRQHHCVGDNLDFIMQGSPPWTISYIWEGHKREVVSRKPAFSRLAEKPGTFTVSRIAHQQNQCSTAVNIVKQIHALPSVTVSSGKNTEQDIREGDEAIIHFNFTGTPPFTFKYTRSMPTPPYEVLEEKTVANIQDYSSSVVASTEGSWAVTYVQDTYCAIGE